MSEYIKSLRKMIGNYPIILCGANVLIIDEQDRLLLQLRSDNYCWSPPGGALEPGETLEETAARETLEETGLICRSLQLFNIYSGLGQYYKYPNGDEVYNISTSYLCRDFEGQISTESDETSSLNFFELEEIPSNLSPPIIPLIEDFKHYLQSGINAGIPPIKTLPKP